VLLALISLGLSLLLWLNGLVDSLARPSVGDALNLHQLELTALAGDLLPPSLQERLVGKDPRAELARELQRQMEAAAMPAPALQRLELALLQRGSDPLAVASQLRELTGQRMNSQTEDSVKVAALSDIQFVFTRADCHRRQTA
jgi:hypothetical protein